MRELEALGRHWRIYDLLEAGSTAEARAEHAALARLAEQLRQPLYRHFARGWEVVWAQMSGRVAEAERLAREAHELGQRAQARDADTIYAAQLLTLRRREDRLAEYVSTVETFVERHPALVAWRAVLPLAHLLNGEREEGVAAFEELAEDDFAAVPRDMFWFTAMCVLSEACSHLGDAVRARAALRASCCRTATGWCRSRRRRASGPRSASSGCSPRPSATSTPPSEHFEAALVLNAEPRRAAADPVHPRRVRAAPAAPRQAGGRRARPRAARSPPTARPRPPGSRCSSRALKPLLDATGAVA